MTCKFCGAPSQATHNGEVLRYTCGSTPLNSKPHTAACWEGLVWELKKRVEALERQVNRKKPVTCREYMAERGALPG